jgi:hypothetical protein
MALRRASWHVGNEDPAIGRLNARNETQRKAHVAAADRDAKATCSCEAALRLQSRWGIPERHRHVRVSAVRVVRGGMDVTTTHLLQRVTHRIEDSSAIRSTLVEGTAPEVDPKVRAANRQLL